MNREIRKSAQFLTITKELHGLRRIPFRISRMTGQTKKLGRVRRVNLTSLVMDSVKNYIADNNLLPGARLPTEKDLTARLGVSRNILREALKSLEAIGLIEIRVGDGMYVSDFDYANVVNHISFAVARNHTELDHFLQARLIIEVGALDLVVERLEDSDIERLEHSVASLTAADTVEKAAEIDLQFHADVLRIAGNPILSEFCSFLGAFFKEAQHLVSPRAKIHTSKVHGDLVEALKDRGVLRAKKIARQHILSWKPVT